MSQALSAKLRARTYTALKFAFAAVVLTLVLGNLPWRDEVRFSDDAGKHTFAGTFLGDWKSERVRFAFDAGIERARLPAAWQRQLANSNVLELARSAQVDWRPGLPSVFRTVESFGLALAFVLLFIAVVAQTTRWWRLLTAVGCSTGWFTALRLCLYGLFFNLVVPGLTGGDVVRAVLVAREHAERRAAAAVSVLVDRLIGLLIVVLVAATVIVLEGDKFAAVRFPVLVALCGGVVGALLYASPGLRRAVRFEHWIGRMPMSRSLLQIDQALLVYSKHPLELLVAALLSVLSHGCVVFAIFVLGRAFGDTTLTLLQYVAVSSIGNVVSTLPVTPGGWGVGEAVYHYLFELIGGDGTIGVAVSITFKLVFALIGVCGGIFLLFPGGRRQMSELRQAPTGLQ